MSGSVPTALRVAAEHLAIDVGAPIAQHLVECVPVALAPGFAEIDLGEEDFFRVPAGRPGDGPSGVTDDQALPLKGLASLDADAIGAGDEHRIAVRGAHRENVGHRLAPVAPDPGIGTQLVGTQTISAPCNAQSRKVSGNQPS